MEDQRRAEPSAPGATVEQETDEDESYDPSTVWPPEPEPLPHLAELDANQSSDTTEAEDDDDADDEDEAEAAPAPTAESEPEPPAAEPEQPPADPKSDRAARRRQRILDEYRASPEYAAEVERQAAAAREAERLEREAAEAAAERQRRIEQATLTTRQKLAKFVGTAAVDPQGTQAEYDRDMAFIRATEAAVLDSDDDYVDPDTKDAVRAAKARIARWDEAREMARIIDADAWDRIKTDYESVLTFPELAALPDADKAKLLRPKSLAEGQALVRQYLLASVQQAHADELAAVRKAHADEVASLQADLRSWRARAGANGAQPETRGKATATGGLTLERYKRLTPEEQADVSPAEIDRMWAAYAAQQNR